jgi:hypothetical protein
MTSVAVATHAGPGRGVLETATRTSRFALPRAGSGCECRKCVTARCRTAPS